MRADGKGLRDALPGSRTVVNAYPTFTPSGREIIFSRLVSRPGNFQLWEATRSGADPHRILAIPGVDVYWPRVSPDGRTVVITELYAHDGSSLAVVSLLTGSVKVIPGTRRLNAGMGAWSPDGRLIAFEGSLGIAPSHIWLVRADGRDLRQLTRSGRSAFNDLGPMFSQDGRTIAFVRNPCRRANPHFSCAYTQSQLWEIGAGGKQPAHQITRDTTLTYWNGDWSSGVVAGSTRLPGR